MCNALFLMTSNLGSHGRTIAHPSMAGDGGSHEGRVHQAVRRHFRPELVNRLSGIYVFRPLEKQDVITIARREIQRLARRQGMRTRGITVSITEPAMAALIAAGYSPALGARPMERAVDRFIGVPLARHLAEHPTDRDCRLTVDMVRGEPRITNRFRTEKEAQAHG